MNSTYYVYEQSTQTRVQDTENSQDHRLSHTASAAVCEILPVTLEAGQVVFLHRPIDGPRSSWLVPYHAGIHPNDTVLLHLAAFLDKVFEPETYIVHSTSWRYDRRMEQLILTYLVVLPQRPWIRQWASTGCIHLECIGTIQKVQGDNLYPPENMKVGEVLAHALDHLALLSRDDRNIQTVLVSEWMDVLQPRLPKPAGCLLVA